MNAWDAALGHEPGLLVNLALLVEIASAGEESFYELDARLPGVRVGVHDSTALFVEGEEARALAEGFADVRGGLSP